MIRDNALQILRTQISREECWIHVRNLKINNKNTDLYKNNTSHSNFTHPDYLQYMSSQANIGWTGTQEVSISAGSYECHWFTLALVKGETPRDTPLQEGAPAELPRVSFREAKILALLRLSHSRRKEDHAAALEVRTSFCSLCDTQSWSSKRSHYFTCLKKQRGLITVPIPLSLYLEFSFPMHAGQGQTSQRKETLELELRVETGLRRFEVIASGTVVLSPLWLTVKQCCLPVHSTGTWLQQRGVSAQAEIGKPGELLRG